MIPLPPIEWVPLAGLAVGFAVLSLAETLNPGRGRSSGDRRLITNFGLGALNIAAGAALPLGTVAAALFAAAMGIGLFRHVALPWPAMLIALLVARSLAAYAVHRLSHRLPLLWRIHRVHHADGAIDVSTGLRNHPLELLIALPAAAAVVAALGPDVPIVLAVDTILLIASIWQHADINLPPRLAARLGLLFVTPCHHRVHHAASRLDHDSNYGDLLLIWDRLFGTYRAPGADRGAVGLADEAPAHDRLGRQLVSPFLPRI